MITFLTLKLCLLYKVFAIALSIKFKKELVNDKIDSRFVFEKFKQFMYYLFKSCNYKRINYKCHNQSAK